MLPKSGKITRVNIYILATFWAIYWLFRIHCVSIWLTTPAPDVTSVIRLYKLSPEHFVTWYLKLYIYGNCAVLPIFLLKMAPGDTTYHHFLSGYAISNRLKFLEWKVIKPGYTCDVGAACSVICWCVHLQQQVISNFLLWASYTYKMIHGVRITL